jgi:hypothetical protein
MSLLHQTIAKDLAAITRLGIRHYAFAIHSDRL